MATQVSDRPTGPDRGILLKWAAETPGEFFRCEYIARVVSPSPRDHIHTHQEERLEVVEGTVRCRVAGREYVLERGSVMVIPPGTPHAVWNDDRGGSRSISEYRPAMNAQALFRGDIVDRPSR